MLKYTIDIKETGQVWVTEANGGKWLQEVPSIVLDVVQEREQLISDLNLKLKKAADALRNIGATADDALGLGVGS